MNPTNQAVTQGQPRAVAPLPDWMVNERPDAAFQSGYDPSESLADGIASSYGVVGYRGKNWSLRYRGQNHLLLRPDDGTPISYIDVVILRQARQKSKSFYPDGFDENASAGKRPDCASLDGERPDSDVNPATRGAEMCALCPHNVWHLDQRGQKTKDCTDYKRMAVFLLPNYTAMALGTALYEPVFLRIPPASLENLGIFGDNLAQQNWPYFSFVTRISFNPQKAHPEFAYTPVKRLTAAESGVILKMREDVIAKRITGEDDIAKRLTGPGPVTASVTSGTAQVQLQRPAAAPMAVAPIAQVAFTAPRPAPAPARVASYTPPQPGQQQQGGILDLFGGSSQPANPAPALSPAPATVFDFSQETPGGAFAVPQEERQATPQAGAAIGQTLDDTTLGGIEDPLLHQKIEDILKF